MASTIISVVHAAQAGFSAYSLYLASISISNLMGYEETSKKAAKYSNTAAHQLHKTRTTQASGTLAVSPPAHHTRPLPSPHVLHAPHPSCLSHISKYNYSRYNKLQTLASLVSAVILIFTTKSTLVELVVTGANLAALVFARQHVGQFWEGKMKVPVPGTGDYNAAITKTQEVRLNMMYLAVSWGVCGLLALVV